MFKTIILKFSALFYHLHVFMRKLALGNTVKLENIKPATEPYILKNKPSTSTKKIVHVNGNFIIGGSTQLIIDIIERTSDLYSHSVIVPDIPDPAPYQPVDVRSFSISEMYKLYEYLKQFKPDLAHIHYWIRDPYKYHLTWLWYDAVFNICKDLGIKVIQNINVPTTPYDSPQILHNVFVSEYVNKNFNTSYVPSSVIYPGSNFEHFYNNDINKLNEKGIGMVYRLDSDKLNESSIEVFIAVAKLKSEVHCYIVGDGQYLKGYKKRVSEEGLIDQFTFTGYVSYNSLPSYYKRFSIFVCPVHDESFGQVTPFAMSMGLAITGYKIGALSEILGSEENFAEHEDYLSLANIIIDLIDDPEKRMIQGLKNQHRAHQLFTVEKMIEDYISLYKKCIDKCDAS